MRTLVPVFAMTAVAGAVFLGANSAAASSSAVMATNQLTNAQLNLLGSGPGYIIANPAAAVRVNGMQFYPTGLISSSTVVIIPNADGSLPVDPAAANAAQLSAAKANESDAAAMTAAIAPTPQLSLENTYAATSTEFSKLYKAKTAIVGNDNTKVSYVFGAKGAQTNAGRGIGWYRGYNGGTFGTYQKTYSLGSAGGQSGASGGGTVPWQGVAAYPQFQAQCATTAVCSGNWGAN